MINTFYVKTSMGKFFGELPFLSKKELNEFNSIGYSGKNSKGEILSRENYLNSLKKGEFQITQTKFDNGDFEEQFIIVWVKKNLSETEIKRILNETNLLNKYDRLKLFYQITKDRFIEQNIFCQILEEYFGLIVK